jgi:hypothetical protein
MRSAAPHACTAQSRALRTARSLLPICEILLLVQSPAIDTMRR